MEITVTLKLRIIPFIIDATNFQRKSRTPNTNSILKVYQLVLKSESEKFSSQKVKFPGISPKSPKNEAFNVIQLNWTRHEAREW